MEDIKTFQDLEELGNNESARMDFILAAINEHKSSTLYKTAVDAELYYEGENPTINKYEKILYDLQGRAHVDMWSANHKIASNFFGFAVDQENGYLLGNGVSFSDAKTKDKLGTVTQRFDSQIQLAGQYALIGGISFCLWNFDHIEVFKVTEFVPLMDEENGSLRAGIRFWQVADNKPLRATLYELDGFTEYVKRESEDLTELRPKQTYKQLVRQSEVSGTEIYGGENYPSFPIVPFMNNSKWKSEICGKRNTIDALDLANSNMVNNVDEGNLIYWVLTNAGGMDDLDDQKFLDRLKTLHVVHTDDDVKAEAHTIEAPFTGTQTAIDNLIKQLYTNFQCFDSSAVSAGNQTATAIKASYIPLDLKTDKFERQATKCINGILSLVGIDDEPTYTRNQIVNKQEEIQSVLMAAEYFDDEYITKKTLTILGDADMFDEIMDRKAAEDLSRFSAEAEQMPPLEDEDTEEDTTDEEAAMSDEYLSSFGDEVMEMLQNLLDSMDET